MTRPGDLLFSSRTTTISSQSMLAFVYSYSKLMINQSVPLIRTRLT